MTTQDVHEAARKGNIAELRSAIANGLDINQSDSSGKTPLHCAVAWKHAAAVSLLLENGADVLKQDEEGKTALHYAVEFNLIGIAGELLESCNDVVAIGDKHGNQPLWTAAFNARGNYDMVKLILRFGGDPKHRNNVSLTPLDIPKRKNEPALLQLLETA